MKKKELKERLAGIINEMGALETSVARESHGKGASLDLVARFVNESSKISSKLDKIWKEI